MTKQFDLMYTTTDLTEKMSSKTSKDFMSKDKTKFKDDNTFSNFLDNANKNYTKKDTVSNTNVKNDNQSLAQDKRNFQSSEKSINKTETQSKNNYTEKDTQTVNEDYKTLDNQVSVTENKNFKSDKTSFIESKEEINLKENLNFISENTTDETKITFADNSALYFQMLNENKAELPTIQNNDLNLTEQDMQSLNLALENVDNVSKEDLISDLYNTDNILNAQDMQNQTFNVIEENNNNSNTKIADNTINNLLTPEIKNNDKSDNNFIKDVKKETPNNIQYTNNTNLAEDKNVKTDLQNDKILSNNIDEKYVNEKTLDTNTDKNLNALASEVKVNTKDNSNVLTSDVKANIEDNSNTLTSDVKTNTEDNSKDITSNLKANTDDNLKTLTSEVKVTSDNNVNDLIKNTIEPRIADIKDNTQQTTVDNNSVVEQISEMKQNIETPVSKNNKNLQNTGIITDEQSEIKDDITGIEFVQQKFTLNTQKDKQANSDTKEQAEETIEPIKIKVDDNIKVVQTPFAKQVQNADKAQNVNKIQKANETLAKSGINTQTLQNADAKVEDIEMSNELETSNNKFVETSQESMLRNKLAEDLNNNTQIQNQVQSQTTSADDVKTDFMQTQDKAVKAENSQQKQPTEDLDNIDILSQIRSKIDATNLANSKKIVIGLTPESLGKLTIQITKGENGISAHILADNQQAKELLEKDLNNLKSTLQSQGVNVNNLSVKVSEAGKSSDSNNNSMFQQNDSGELGQDGKNSHSEHNKENEQNDRKTFDFIHKQAMEQNNEEPEVTNSADTLQTEKTVNIKGSTGKISYKL
jgi:flagellar hook-length control protein FliK